MPPKVTAIATGSGALPPIKSASPTKQAANAKPDNQIYSYHKLFWRLNCTLEFNIFYHPERKLYELAAYNSEKDQEFEPLYMAEEPVKKQLFGPDNLQSEMDKIKLKLSKDRFTHMPTTDKLIEMAHNSIFNKFVESHLNPKADGTLVIANLPGETLDIDSMISVPPQVEVEEVPEPAGAEEVEVSVEQENNASIDNVGIIGNKASNAVPISSVGKTKVVRHRSSIHEFNKTLNILKKDSQSLKAANRMTENLLNLSKMSVNAFKDALDYKAGSSKRYDKSTPLGRFRWAVHRIILQRYVEAVRLRIDSMGKKKTAIRINGTFPMPGSTDMNSPQAQILSLAGRLNSTARMQSLGEVLSRDNTPQGTPQGTPRGKTKKKAENLVKQSMSLPIL